MHQRQSAVGVWLSLLLGCAFALSALFLVLFGADAYLSVLDNDAQNDITRTATLYVANKVRQYDESGAISIASIEDVTALVLKNTIDNEAVLTYLYLYKGNLCEVSAFEGTLVNKSAGQPVLPLSELSFTLSGQGLFRASVKDANGHSASIILYLRTAEVSP